MSMCFVNQNAHVYIKTVHLVVFSVGRNTKNLTKRESTRANVPITKRGNG